MLSSGVRSGCLRASRRARHAWKRGQDGQRRLHPVASGCKDVAKCGAVFGAFVGGSAGLYLKKPRKTHANASALYEVVYFGASKLAFTAAGIVYGAGVGAFIVAPAVVLVLPVSCIVGPNEAVLYPLIWIVSAYDTFMNY
jgi:hypothetical protein